MFISDHIVKRDTFTDICLWIYNLRILFIEVYKIEVGLYPIFDTPFVKSRLIFILNVVLFLG